MPYSRLPRHHRSPISPVSALPTNTPAPHICSSVKEWTFSFPVAPLTQTPISHLGPRSADTGACARASPGTISIPGRMKQTAIRNLIGKLWDRSRRNGSEVGRRCQNLNFRTAFLDEKSPGKVERVSSNVKAVSIANRQLPIGNPIYTSDLEPRTSYLV